MNDSSGTTAWASRIRPAGAALHALLTPIEQAFLAMGERLAAAHGIAGDLAAVTQQLAGRLSSPELADMLSGLSGAVSLVEHMWAQHLARGEILGRVAQSVDGIRSALTGLAQTMGRINVLGINARIESAHLSALGVDFSVFTHGVVDLAANGNASLAKAQADLARFRRASEGAAAVHGAFERNHMGELTAIGDRLNASIATLDARQRRTAAVMERLPGALGAIHTAIGRIIMDLQAGDMTIQRLDHVIKALAIMDQAIAQVEAGGPDAMPDRDLRVLIHAVSELQQRQLREIARELGGKCSSIATSIAGFCDAIDALGRQVDGACQGEATTGGEDSLHPDFEKVAAIVGSYRTAVLDSERHMSAVAKAAADMDRPLREVADIDAEISVIGLNASIQCGNIGGKGRTLNIVAQELRSYTRETRALTQRVTARLHDATAAAAELREGAADLDALLELERSLGGSVAMLRAVGEETDQVLGRIHSGGGAAISSTRELLTGFSAEALGLGVIERTAQGLDALVREVDPHLPLAELQELRREVLSFMEAHYTMASERDIHTALLGGTPEAPTATVSAEAAMDDLLF